jgi:energy-coupling factor transporter ATP-binding protein EcfA2
MPRIDVVNTCRVENTFRCQQVEGMFDLPPAQAARIEIHAEVPSLDEPWQIGVIVGPSGSGKSTLAKAAWGAMRTFTWPRDRAMIDGFETGDIRAITQALVSVGLSSPPAWLRPFHVLSNGEQFRAQMARTLLAGEPVAVVDEFTSVVDRQVAQVCAAATAKAIRRESGVRLVAVSCHYDILPWLEPDWVLDMADGRLERMGPGVAAGCQGHDPSTRQTRGRLCRPELRFEVRQAGASLWAMFRRHHYLNHNLPSGCRCWAALHDGRPIAFAAVAGCIGFAGYRRFSRVVVLPDYQGIGIGSRFRDAVAAIEMPRCRRLSLVTSHPGMIRSLEKSRLWRRVAVAWSTGAAGMKCSGHFRRTVSFVYTGGGKTIDAAC